MYASLTWSARLLVTCVALGTLLLHTSTALPSALAQQADAIMLSEVADLTDVEATRPVVITHAGDGSKRLFIVEQAGRVWILDNGTLRTTPFLDIRSLVRSSSSEQGLLGLAFDPEYKQNGFIYVNYTSEAEDGDTIIARYKVSDSNPNEIDPNSATRLLRIEQPQTNHNGGDLTFGPDGYLYISSGDGGGGGDVGEGHNPVIGNGQDLNTLLGKVLRIDVRNTDTSDGLPYDIPADNPFAEDDAPNSRGEIWAYGLRNPWRISFDRQTGDLFIADVGQGSIEEVNWQAAASTGGENYGWRCKEGNQNFANDATCAGGNFVAPILTYNHNAGRCSVTGGYRYRGDKVPALGDQYIYGDFCSGEIWSASPTGSTWNSTLLLDTAMNISTFGEDEDGELYVADLSSAIIYKFTGVAHSLRLPIILKE